MEKHKLNYLDLDNVDGGWAELFRDIPEWIAELKKPKYDPLEKKVELDYVKNGLKDEVIWANMRFVTSLARHYLVKNINVRDLISYGNEGLVEAYDTFSPKKNVKFISWAVYLIRAKMVDCIRDNSSFKLGKKAIKLLNDYSKYNSIAAMKAAHPNRYSQSEEKIERKLDLYIPFAFPAYLDEKYPNGTAVWVLADKNIVRIGTEKVLGIIKASTLLTKDEKTIVINSFGLHEKKALSHEAIGKLSGVSGSTIQRRLNRILIRLQSVPELKDLFDTSLENDDESKQAHEKAWFGDDI